MVTIGAIIIVTGWAFGACISLHFFVAIRCWIVARGLRAKESKQIPTAMIVSREIRDNYRAWESRFLALWAAPDLTCPYGHIKRGVDARRSHVWHCKECNQTWIQM